jgi:CheY-like chemotaxis protein
MGDGATILVIDDDEDLRETVAALLELLGYRVSSAASGRAALELLDGAALPDLILLDLMMPEMSGWQFRAEQLRRPSLAKIPVVVVTASRNFDETVLEASSVILKPFAAEELSAAVAKALKPSAIG